MNPIRWGVLGAAAIAIDRFMPAMAGARAATLAGIASRSADKAKTVAQTFGIPRHFDSYEALIDDPGIDALYVPVPNHLHVEWSVRALEAGKHVLCEKPLCLSAKDVVTLIARARQERPPHRGGVFLSQPSAVGEDRRVAGGRRDRRAARRARHARAAVPRSERHPQQSGPGRRRTLRPGLVHDQRLQCRVGARAEAGDRRDRPRPGVEDRPPVHGAAGLRRRPRHVHRRVAERAVGWRRTTSSRSSAATAGCAAICPMRTDAPRHAICTSATTRAWARSRP